MTILCRPSVWALLFLIALPLEIHSQTPISGEWKLRLTEGMRRRVVVQSVNPFSAEVVSATPSLPRSAPSENETPSILSSLSQLLTQAATETVSLSREIRPNLEWPGRFWNLQDSEEWSWRRRFSSFQTDGGAENPNTHSGGVSNATSERTVESEGESSGRPEPER